MSELTLYEHWANVVRENAERTALICCDEGVRWTFAAFDQRISALARGLHRIGMRKGDRVGVWLGNRSEHAMLQLATAKLGLILTSLNPAFRADDLRHALKATGCRALITSPTIRTSDMLHTLMDILPSMRQARQHAIEDDAAPELRSVLVVDNVREAGRYDDAMGRSTALVPFADVLSESNDGPDANVDSRTMTLRNDDICAIQLSSGTTARAKAIPLTHRNVLNNGLQIGQRMRIGPDDRLCNAPPLFHCFGSVLGQLAFWTHGAGIVYPSESFDPNATLRAVVRECCTALHGVPTMFISVLSALELAKAGQLPDLPPDEIHLSSLRTGIAAGSPVPAPLMAALVDARAGLGISELTIAYGMTETSPVSFMSRTDDPIERRIDSVGRVLPHLSAKIVDPLDTAGEPLPIGSNGELLVRGYSTTPGYWNDEGATAQLFVDHADGRWLRSGDIGALDDEGFLRINGRIKDLIMCVAPSNGRLTGRRRGGENISPVAVEAMCMCATIHLPD